jgi:alcohol dehydrogenase (cytochrome c)
MRLDVNIRSSALKRASIFLAFALAVVTFVAAIPDLRWRAIVVARKVTGQVIDVTWADLAALERAGARVDLRKLAGSGNPYSSIANPATTSGDSERGRDLFAVTCEKCHGARAAGGAGPALVARTLTHGDSDWALYRTITQGVGGTAMQGDQLPRTDVWKVIAYLRQLNRQARASGFGPASGAPSRPAVEEVTPERLLAASSATVEWLLPGGSYNGQRFSKDTQIAAANVSRLRVQWIHQFSAGETPNESTPIVAGNYIYATAPPSTVIAMDVRTGREIWQFSRSMPVDLRLCCLATNRGVAVFGRRVYLATLDAHLVALDAGTGQVLWDTKVSEYSDGYSMTSAPLVIGNSIVVGIAGGDHPIRGHISSYDAETGALRWRFNSIPAPGEPGHESWGGESWRTGGAATWGIGSFDPELGLVYWGVGNPAPDYSASERPGDNLYSNCVVALDAATGHLAWYFQFTPGDDHDWDSIQTPALIDMTRSGAVRKLLAVANRNGYFYVLDRRNGAFVRGRPFAKQTWTTGLSQTGRPIRTGKSGPSPEGTYLYPSVSGATNWWPSAYSPITQLYYVNVVERGGLFFRQEPLPRPSMGHMYTGGVSRFVDGEPFDDFVRAIDPASGDVRWERHNSTPASAPRGGLLATASGLLFGSDGSVLYALDAMTGQQLWAFDTGAQISAPPITYRVDGRQVIAVVAGHDLTTFMLAEP